MHDPVQNFIGGDYVDPRSGQWLDNIDPASGQVLGQVANSGAEDIQAAVEAARGAAPRWATTSAEERCRILSAIAQGIEQRVPELAALECEDGGKPICRAESIEIPRAAANFRFYASAMMHFASQLHENPGQGSVNLTLRRPLGVVACISPWNLPLYLFTWKIAPALVAGNTVIGKPSELTPRTAAMLGHIARESGLPPGVLNIVHGAGPTAGQPILEHPEIRAISFTGGTRTGQHVASVAGPLLKKVSLELGGKNPNLIFADCDYPRALATSVMASFANQGQICLCGSRIFIERSIYDRFVEDLVQRAQELVVGDPKNQDTEIGAVISRDHFEKITSYLEQAKQGGRWRPHPVRRRARQCAVASPGLLSSAHGHCRGHQPLFTEPRRDFSGRWSP